MFYAIVLNLFRVCTVAFLLKGLAIVVGQGAGLVVGDGEIVTGVMAALIPYVFGCAGIAGLLAFVMSYMRQSEDDEV